MATISPFFWFDSQAEEAAGFYVSLFANSRITNVSHGADGKAFGVSFVLDGLEMQAMNAGSSKPFTDAISFFTSVDSQSEIDRLWDALTSGGGAAGRCGWLVDRYGVSWQIVPPVLGQLLGDPDAARAGRVLQAMLAMTKIDIAALEAA
jgi:predicted 3-demethylubiquinone-9 3-methyltransferase (glyoxalase superfamily)